MKRKRVALSKWNTEQGRDWKYRQEKTDPISSRSNIIKVL